MMDFVKVIAKIKRIHKHPSLVYQGLPKIVFDENSRPADYTNFIWSVTQLVGQDIYPFVLKTSELVKVDSPRRGMLRFATNVELYSLFPDNWNNTSIIFVDEAVRKIETNVFHMRFLGMDDPFPGLASHFHYRLIPTTWADNYVAISPKDIVE